MEDYYGVGWEYICAVEDLRNEDSEVVEWFILSFGDVGINAVKPKSARPSRFTH